MNKKWMWTSVVLVFLTGLFVWQGCKRSSSGSSQGTAMPAHKAKYQCSMHPQIVSDKPGTCPICGMKLEKVDEDIAEEAAQQTTGQRKVLYYRNPMRPDVTSPMPAKDNMGMDYIPVYSDEMSSGTSTVEGHAPFAISTERQQLIGVTTTVVKRQSLTVEIRTVGKVAYDPELYTALAEYREATIAKEKIKDSPLPEAHEHANSLVRSSVLRLRLMGLSDEQIQALVSHSDDSTNLLLPGKTAWIYGQVYENEVDLIRPGQSVRVSAPSLPGHTYYGKITAIDPVLNSMSRTAKVRAEISTPQERLRPEMFVHVYIQIPLGDRLAVPVDAILDTGEDKIVFVKKGKGQFEPRSIETGREAQNVYEVLSGLQEGEEIVTSANFLIDSESRFRSALSGASKKTTSSR